MIINLLALGHASSILVDLFQFVSGQDERGNLLVTEFGLSKFRDHQTISIKEMLENSAPGQLPRSLDVIADDDLVGICKSGDSPKQSLGQTKEA